MICKLDCFRSRTSNTPNAFSPAILKSHWCSKLFAPSRDGKRGFFWTSLGSKNPSKNRSRHRGPPLPSSRTCVDINVRRVWRTCSRCCNTLETKRYGKLLSRTCRNNRNLHYFSPGGKNFADKTAPVLVSRNGPQNGGHSFSLNLICLCPDDLAPVLGSVSGPQNGGRLPAKFLPPVEK